MDTENARAHISDDQCKQDAGLSVAPVQHDYQQQVRCEQNSKAVEVEVIEILDDSDDDDLKTGEEVEVIEILDDEVPTVEHAPSTANHNTLLLQSEQQHTQQAPQQPQQQQHAQGPVLAPSVLSGQRLPLPPRLQLGLDTYHMYVDGSFRPFEDFCVPSETRMSAGGYCWMTRAGDDMALITKATQTCSFSALLLGGTPCSFRAELGAIWEAFQRVKAAVQAGILQTPAALFVYTDCQAALRAITERALSRKNVKYHHLIDAIRREQAEMGKLLAVTKLMWVKGHMTGTAKLYGHGFGNAQAHNSAQPCAVTSVAVLPADNSSCFKDKAVQDRALQALQDTLLREGTCAPPAPTAAAAAAPPAAAPRAAAEQLLCAGLGVRHDPMKHSGAAGKAQRAVLPNVSAACKAAARSTAAELRAAAAAEGLVMPDTIVIDC